MPTCTHAHTQIKHPRAHTHTHAHVLAQVRFINASICQSINLHFVQSTSLYLFVRFHSTGVYLTDLTFLDELPTKLDNGLINFDKMSRVGNVLVTIRNWQQSSYQLERVALIQDWILARQVMSEDDMIVASKVRVWSKMCVHVCVRVCVSFGTGSRVAVCKIGFWREGDVRRWVDCCVQDARVWLKMCVSSEMCSCQYLLYEP